MSIRGLPNAYETYQTIFFHDRYDIDDFSENKEPDSLDLRTEKEGYINYMYLSNTDSIVALYNIIHGNIHNKADDISPNDITILGFTTKELRMFDCYYRYASREHTNSMLETIEEMYMTHLNLFGKDIANADEWFKYLFELIQNKLFSRKTTLYDFDRIKIRHHMAILLTLYNLYSKYSDQFYNRLEDECKKSGLAIQAFLAFAKRFEEELSSFKSKVFDDSYSIIRENKKLHFWMNSGTIKISTIHSFKGWESEVVFLIIERKYDIDTDYNVSFDEILYTGLTRCKKHLILINFGNEEYDKKLRPLIEKLK